jgi:hypothetical protein
VHHLAGESCALQRRKSEDDKRRGGRKTHQSRKQGGRVEPMVNYREKRERKIKEDRMKSRRMRRSNYDSTIEFGLKFR